MIVLFLHVAVSIHTRLISRVNQRVWEEDRDRLQSVSIHTRLISRVNPLAERIKEFDAILFQSTPGLLAG